MKFYTRIPHHLQLPYRRELAQYRRFFAKREWPTAWHHLERAHIIGQRYPLAHSYVHWLMLRFGIRLKNTREVLGQIPRLLVGGVKSFVGKVPVGNTGGANVPPLQPMPIPADLKRVLDDSGDF
ncbi:DUF3703 domain-containing protein [Marinoscillum furvescens]|nr:DUF3703 domain-containing protein [Marinoscillum furvescens]